MLRIIFIYYDEVSVWVIKDGEHIKCLRRLSSCFGEEDSVVAGAGDTGQSLDPQKPLRLLVLRVPTPLSPPLRSGAYAHAPPASRALDPDEIAACICHKEEALRWGSDLEIDEILARAFRCVGDNGSLGGSTAALGREKNREMRPKRDLVLGKQTGFCEAIIVSSIPLSYCC
uniref:Uncharacterized protein n=1 Tax=Nelumbo nucifera TaxID=4432 RepID=A0A822XIU2_NELNU|nr:TPA_asm: hypothetical protein HUJ06_021630 [Nelumbo nucifera]